MLIKNYGLFWERNNVSWSGAKGRPGRLLGSAKYKMPKQPNQKSKYSKQKNVIIDFREQYGIYILQHDLDIIYIGQTGKGRSGTRQSLYSRLKAHRNGTLEKRWNKFSWFGLRDVDPTNQELLQFQAERHDIQQILDHLEAILMEATEPIKNKQGGRWGKAKEFEQVRDINLGPSDDEMLKQIWRNMGSGHDEK